MRISLLALVPLATLFPAPGYAGPLSACRPNSGSADPGPTIVDHYLADVAAKRRWAVVVDCRHPGWPPQAEEVPFVAETSEPGQFNANSAAGRTSAGTSPTPSITAGSVVELCSDHPARIRVSGTALQSASAGQGIRVLVGVSGKTLYGVVRGPHLVQLEVNAMAGRLQ